MFNNWKTSEIAKDWLSHMGYNLEKVESVTAIQVPTRISKKDSIQYGILESEYEETTKYKKADAQIKIFITLTSVIKVENLSLKKANSDSNFNQVDKRQIDTYQKMWKFDNELAHWLKLFTGEILPKNETTLDINILREYDKRIFIDEFPKRVIVKLIEFLEQNRILIVSDIKISPRGSISIGKITMQRKGGTPDPTSLQFKINPCGLFELS